MNIRQIIRPLFISCFIICLFILPDYLYQFVDNSFHFYGTARKFLKFLVPFSVGLALGKSRVLELVLITFLFVLQLMQFSHLAYFGSFLAPHDFYSVFSELGDIAKEANSVFWNYWQVIVLLLIPFGLMIILLKRKSLKTYFGSFLSVAMLGVVIYGDCSRNHGGISEYRFTLDNSLKALATFLESSLKSYNPPSYLDYSSENLKLSESPITVVCIIGESVNYKHMSLFGYNRETTPNLKQLSKSDDFYYTLGISRGVSTIVSTKFLMNAIGEPDNVKLNYSDKVNLFKLAKSSGFKTFYILNQDAGILSSIGGKGCIDVYRIGLLDPKRSECYSDDYLLRCLDDIEFDKNRNFIVLHQRALHTPYSDFTRDYSKHFSKGQNQKVDNYDNAMLYNDQIISTIFKFFNKQKRGKFYIIWASDHNELFNEAGGINGHGQLFPECADIPIMVQTNDKEFLDEFKSIFRPTHYEISKMIAKILGWKIINPNEEKDVFYISGIDIDGKYGYIKLKKNLDKKNIKYIKKG